MSLGLVTAREVILITGVQNYLFNIAYFEHNQLEQIVVDHITYDPVTLLPTITPLVQGVDYVINATPNPASTTYKAVLNNDPFTADKYRSSENIQEGGEVSLLSFPYLDEGELVVRRTTARTQDVDYGGERFPADTVEGSFDTVAFQIQEIDDRMNQFQDYLDSLVDPPAVEAWVPLILGTPVAPIEVPATGLVFQGKRDTTIYVAGEAGAPIAVTGAPAIVQNSTEYLPQIGDRLTLIGTSNAATVEFFDGNGLDMNDSFKLAQGRIIDYIWNGSIYEERGRNR